MAIHRKKVLLITRPNSRRSPQAAPPLGTGVSGWREYPSQGGWRVYPVSTTEKDSEPAPGSSSSTHASQSSTVCEEDGLRAAATDVVNQPFDPSSETEDNDSAALTVQMEDSTQSPGHGRDGGGDSGKS